MMSDQATTRLAEIAARLNAASQQTTMDVHAGSSTLRASVSGGDRGRFVDGMGDLVAATVGETGPLMLTVADDEDGQDATLALHARDDLEWLLSLVEQLQGQLDRVREGQIALARALHETSAGSDGRTAMTRARYEGMAAGAGLSLQVLLVELGEVEYDEGAEPTWDVVTGEGADDAM